MWCACLSKHTEDTKYDVSQITGRRPRITPGNREDMLMRQGGCVCMCMFGDSLCGT